MQTLTDGYRAIGLLIDVNWDRLIFPFAVMAALVIGGQISNVIH